MHLNITKFNTPSAKHYSLLLTADPSKKIIGSYLSHAFCYQAITNAQLAGVIILLPTHPDTLEIMNIAVDSKWQNHGIAQQLLSFAENLAHQQNYSYLEIGTGTTSFEQLYLYQKCGFRITSVKRDFFTDRYDSEIIENGLHLKDMLRLKKVL